MFRKKVFKYIFLFLAFFFLYTPELFAGTDTNKPSKKRNKNDYRTSIKTWEGMWNEASARIDEYYFGNIIASSIFENLSEYPECGGDIEKELEVITELVIAGIDKRKVQTDETVALLALFQNKLKCLSFEGISVLDAKYATYIDWALRYLPADQKLIAVQGVMNLGILVTDYMTWTGEAAFLMTVNKNYNDLKKIMYDIRKPYPFDEMGFVLYRIESDTLVQVKNEAARGIFERYMDLMNFGMGFCTQFGMTNINKICMIGACGDKGSFSEFLDGIRGEYRFGNTVESIADHAGSSGACGTGILGGGGNSGKGGKGNRGSGGASGFNSSNLGSCLLSAVISEGTPIQCAARDMTGWVDNWLQNSGPISRGKGGNPVFDKLCTLVDENPEQPKSDPKKDPALEALQNQINKDKNELENSMKQTEKNARSNGDSKTANDAKNYGEKLDKATPIGIFGECPSGAGACFDTVKGQDTIMVNKNQFLAGEYKTSSGGTISSTSAVIKHELMHEVLKQGNIADHAIMKDFGIRAKMNGVQIGYRRPKPDDADMSCSKGKSSANAGMFRTIASCFKTGDKGSKSEPKRPGGGPVPFDPNPETDMPPSSGVMGQCFQASLKAEIEKLITEKTKQCSNKYCTPDNPCSCGGDNRPISAWSLFEGLGGFNNPNFGAKDPVISISPEISTDTRKDQDSSSPLSDVRKNCPNCPDGL